MKYTKLAIMLSATAFSSFAFAQAVTGELTGKALVQAVSLGVASQGSVSVGTGPINSSTATVGVTTPVTTASITALTLTPVATLVGGTTTAVATGPGSSSSFTNTGTASAFTVVPVINGTESVTSLTNGRIGATTNPDPT